MEYKIVTAMSVSSLETSVRWAIEEGWELTGSMAVKRGGFLEFDEYSQPMTRES